MASKKRKLLPKSKNTISNVGKLTENSNNNSMRSAQTSDSQANATAENDCSHDDESQLNVFSPDNRLSFSFYNQDCVSLAKALLGKKLVRRLSCGEILSGMIVETEAYLGGEDKASHSYNGRKTKRNASMFLQPGTAYVYNIYGMYTCFNISSHGDGAAILIRALQADDGIDRLRSLRGCRRNDRGSGLKLHQLCNGPCKLTMAMQIDRSTVDGCDMCNSEVLWLEEGVRFEDDGVVVCKRVGIDSAGVEWACKPLRFYVRGNSSVSVRDKAAEIEQTTDSVT